MNPVASLRRALQSGPGAYECRGCGSAFEIQYHVCPHCEGFSVERNWAEQPIESAGRRAAALRN